MRQPLNYKRIHPPKIQGYLMKYIKNQRHCSTIQCNCYKPHPQHKNQPNNLELNADSEKLSTEQTQL